MNDDEIKEALMLLAFERGPEKTFCPSEVARSLAPADWRPLMPAIRRCAGSLPLRATQRGNPVDPVTAKGPIRLSIDPLHPPRR
ncbi:MAG: DUF3253 domain-containing protein [Pseudomonadota bacterium]